MTAECVRCSRPMADQAYACQACADKGAEQLRTVADMTPAARDVAHGQSRRSGGGGASGKPESRLPFDLGATSKLDAVQGELTGWVRHIAEERGLIMSPGWPAKGSDLIVEAAEWLLGHLGWLRHRQEVSEALSGIAAAARIVAGIARGPAAQRFLGPCGALLLTPEPWEPGMPASAECDGDVYAREGAQRGVCRTCGAEVSTAERQAWLDGEVRAYAFRAAHIAQAYGVNVDTIRTWSTRPRPDTGEPALASWWRTPGGLVTPWTEPVLDPRLTGDERAAREAEIAAELDARGPRLHYVGDVLDLAAARAARRETERAKRERRAATRAEESEEVA